MPYPHPRPPVRPPTTAGSEMGEEQECLIQVGEENTAEEKNLGRGRGGHPTAVNYKGDLGGSRSG